MQDGKGLDLCKNYTLIQSDDASQCLGLEFFHKALLCNPLGGQEARLRFCTCTKVNGSKAIFHCSQVVNAIFGGLNCWQLCIQCHSTLS